MAFDYGKIPVGFYDKILIEKNGIRKFWHWHKFDSVTRSLKIKPNDYFLDVGCFCGSLIGRFIPYKNTKCVGIDILKDQIEYANQNFNTENRNFIHIDNFDDATNKLRGHYFTKISCIEVLEHLSKDEIKKFFEFIDSISLPGTEIIITTPNYMSLWPVLELIVNNLSEVDYEEQHLTKFFYPNVEKKLNQIYPEFNKKFVIKFKTTSHFFTPYLAAISYEITKKISAAIHPEEWKNPLGSLIILNMIKK